MYRLHSDSDERNITVAHYHTLYFITLYSIYLPAIKDSKRTGPA